MSDPISRRSWLAATAGGLSMSAAVEAKPDDNPGPTFGFCLNTSTVRLPEGQWGKPRPIVELVAIAAKAGYQAIEPWISELDEYAKGGGSLKDLGKRIADAGLKVPD